MIKIENVHVSGFDAAIRGMRNPKNSWEKSDSEIIGDTLLLGENDLKLAKTLAHGGPVHGKFLRMIHVSADVTAPLYWWKQADKYQVGTVTNSCSTMHKIHSKEFTIEDFSHEHMNQNSITVLEAVIKELNLNREFFNVTKNKDYWWQMIQLLPSSYNQLKTYDLNYEVIRNQYFYRKNHKLDEWREYCDWALTLPYFKELCTEVEIHE